MGLLTEVQVRLSVARIAQLSNSDLSANPQNVPVAGTVALVNGSAAVVGTGTAFTSLVVGNVISFSPQQGVNYVIQAVADDTHLTLAAAYTGAANAAATAISAGINYPRLQAACSDAVLHFVAHTDIPWDDTTVTNYAVVPNVINKCFWVGVPLVIAYLYEQRGQPWPDAEVASAWATAKERLDRALRMWGDGAWSPPQSDSVYEPTIGPERPPVFDTARFGTIIPAGPGANPAGGNGWGQGTPNDWIG